MDDKGLMTLSDFKNSLHAALDSFHGPDEVDSFLILLSDHYLNFRRIDIVLNKNIELSKKQEKMLMLALDKLKTQMPIQYILGKTEFMGLKFNVDKHVLIPRPETEELVQWIIQENESNKETKRILDIGTGSGCIAIALSKHLSTSKVIGCDISEEALIVAKNNADLNEAETEFKQFDILSGKDNEGLTDFDIIVSNPPYVRETEKSMMKSNVLDYEPHSALFVKNDNPLLFYDRIIEFANKNLKKNGELYFEINEYLSRELILLLEKKTFKNIELRQDLFGKHRMIKAIK